MISLVRLGDRRRDAFKGGVDGEFLAVGVPNQHIADNAEALDRRRKSRFAARRVERHTVFRPTMRMNSSSSIAARSPV